MKIAGIDFPKSLLNALRDGELIVFAGAGVSMGDPANLPSFKCLARAIGQGTGEALQGDELEDSYLGRLQHQKGVQVHERAAQKLAKDDPKPTSLHRDLLRLYPDPQSVRVVTTNFDLLFEEAARTVFASEPEVFKAPALPLGRAFNGTVHIHGAVSRPSEMVLTDADFGRAYLTEGWARRFLVDLFRSVTVLFVGYSHDDTVMRYLARGLPASDTKPRFALTAHCDESRWTALNITPITYPRSPGDCHESLYEGVERLAEYKRRGTLDWKREITAIAQKPPPLDEEDIDLIEEALTNPILTRFFTESAAHLDWIDWLDKRKHLDCLFATEDLQPQDRRLAIWLADKFAICYPNIVFLLISKHEMRIHPDLWYALSRAVGQERDPPMDTDGLSRWTSILLATAAPSPDQYMLSAISERCLEAGLIDSIMDIFEAMTIGRLVLERGFNWFNTAANDLNPPVDVEVNTSHDHFMLDAIWENGLRPNLDKVAEPLLGRVVHRLEIQHRGYQAWQESNRDWNPKSYRRSAIEPHTQNRHPGPTDVLIDAARECLECLARKHPDAAAAWCDRLVRSDAPILRRLAVHALQHRADSTADEKVDWLLNRIGLHDLAAHHETYQALRVIYPDVSVEQRTAVIDAVQAYRWFDAKDSAYKRRTAYNHFRWLDWLHEADPACIVVEQALNAIMGHYPDFSAADHQDFLSWSGEVTMVIPESPWSAEELISLPAQHKLAELLSFQQTDFTGPSRDGLLRALEQAATLKFEWGLDLADALTASGHWDTDIWLALMRAWCCELDENKHRDVLFRLMRPELYPKHTRLSADVLYELVRQGDVPYLEVLLPEANALATYLWRTIDHNEPIIERHDWLNISINHSAGVLAQFWAGSLSKSMNRQDPMPSQVNADLIEAITTIMHDKSLAGRLGRSVFARNFSLFLSYDIDWIKTEFLPLFETCNDKEDYQALWDGLTYGRLTPAAVEVLDDAFINALAHIETVFSSQERRRRFINIFAEILIHIANNPLAEWIPRFFEYADSDSRGVFAAQIGHLLGRLDDSQQCELWERWLRQFWEGRLQGVPVGLIDGEIGEMIRWTTRLKSLYPDAVALATKMPNIEANSGRHIWTSLHRIQDERIWHSHPQSTAKFLLYLKPLLLHYHSPDKIKQLIDELRQMQIPPTLVGALTELFAELP